MSAVSCVELVTVVETVVPLKTTTDEATNSFPVSARERSDCSEENVIVVGEIEVSAGAGRELPHRGFKALHPSIGIRRTSNKATRRHSNIVSPVSYSVVDVSRSWDNRPCRAYYASVVFNEENGGQRYLRLIPALFSARPATIAECSILAVRKHLATGSSTSAGPSSRYSLSGGCCACMYCRKNTEKRIRTH